MDWFPPINPFVDGGLLFNRRYTLQRMIDSRTIDNSSKAKRIDLVDFLGAPPALVQRATENIAFLDDMLPTQRAPYKILTQDREMGGVEVDKGMVIYDQETEKSYQVLVPYKHVMGHQFFCGELDD